jgi:hypothetical protein
MDEPDWHRLHLAGVCEDRVHGYSAASRIEGLDAEPSPVRSSF